MEFAGGLTLAIYLLSCSSLSGQDGWWGNRFFQEPLSAPDGFEAFGAGDPYGELVSPRIPEPLVFDLVRPLGARQGELEVNVLALFPYHRRRVAAPPDALGLVTTGRTEWAPEIEYALWDGFALEFEVPFEDDDLAAWKGAAQWTFGTAFDEAFIHGLQVIGEYVREPDLTELTFLYLFGIRFDEQWSTLVMIGMRGNIRPDDPAERAETLLNWSIFRDLTDTLTAGLEANYSSDMNGDASLLLMPQIHWEIRDRWMLQVGSGVRFLPDHTLALAAVRGIYTF